MSAEREKILRDLYTTYSGVFSALNASKARAASETGALSELGALHRACGLFSKGEFHAARVELPELNQPVSFIRPSRRSDVSGCGDTAEVVQLLGQVPLGSVVCVPPDLSTRAEGDNI